MECDHVDKKRLNCSSHYCHEQLKASIFDTVSTFIVYIWVAKDVLLTVPREETAHSKREGGGKESVEPGKV